MSGCLGLMQRGQALHQGSKLASGRQVALQGRFGLAQLFGQVVLQFFEQFGMQRQLSLPV